MNRPVPAAQGQLHQRGMEEWNHASVVRSRRAKKKMNSMQTQALPFWGEWHKRKRKQVTKGALRRSLKWR